MKKFKCIALFGNKFETVEYNMSFKMSNSMFFGTYYFIFFNFIIKIPENKYFNAIGFL